jgi:hypothetical protein
MFLQIAFKADPRTHPLYLKMTSYFSVYTNIEVFSDVFNGEQIKAGAQLVEALCYKPESRGFDSQWCDWNFSLT